MGQGLTAATAATTAATVGALQATTAAAGTAANVARNNVVTSSAVLAGQNAVPLARGTVAAASRAVTPNANLLRNVQLPKCQQSNVLLSAGGFPTNWQQLTAQQQAEHPINMVMFQLGYSVYQAPEQLPGCLGPMGMDTKSIKFIHAKDTPVSAVTALVMKAANERIFVAFKGSDIPNVITDLNCRYSGPAGAAFGAPTSDIRMHDGFYRAWQALEKDVVTTVTSYLKQAPGAKIHVIGHSLGASLASIAALRLQKGGVLPASADVAGVWLLAAPRAGNGAWRDAYNAALLTRTLRFSNFRDFAARLPQQSQDCSSGGLAAALTERGQYAHVGRSVVQCPAASGGLVQWNVYSSGSETLECGAGKDGPDTSGSTHMLGAYFDAWRRGHLASKGSDLAKDARTAAVLCEQCTDKRLLQNMRLTRLDAMVANPPARAGGPVTCFNNDACRVQRAWSAATSVGSSFTAAAATLTGCSGYVCVDLGV
ncbi:hypothetical protein OEZ86_014200 [Tetradesmus obliquus]|nr:hypothetical protein OEZ86_014200 [Tetradesmus obliquus]